MSSEQSPSSTNPIKAETPCFGSIQQFTHINLHAGTYDFEDDGQQNNEKNIPQTILEKSSNSSDDNIGMKFYDMKQQSQNNDLEIVIVKEQPVSKKSKSVKKLKSKSDYNGINMLKENLTALTKTDKPSDVLYSSLGVPAIDNSRKKTILNQKEAEQDCKLCKQGGWTRTKLMMTQNRLALFQFSLDIQDLEKIKILPWTNQSKTKSQNIIKIAFNNQVQLFSLSTDKKGYQVPISYYIFSRLIEKKLAESNSYEMSSWQKQEHSFKKVIEDSYIYGSIYKRSQMLGNWQKRYIVIKKNGIYSYRNSAEDEKYSFFISSSSFKYMWTRFEKIEGFLILKIKHGLYKTQFGIPITEFSVRSPVNWLYYFYRVLPMMSLEQKQ